MTALPGWGALPELPVEGPRPGGVEPAGAAPGDEEPEELGFSSLSCCANGSLLAKRLKDASWPSCTRGTLPEASEPVGSVVVPALPCSAPWRVGAASVGVPAGGAAVVVVAEAVGGGLGWSCFSTRGTWKASKPRNRTPRSEERRVG